MDLSIVVHIKSSFDEWKAIFDADSEKRAKFVDESRTLCGKVDDKTAIINIYNVDMAAMQERMSGPDFEEITATHVEKHVIASISALEQPS